MIRTFYRLLPVPALLLALTGCGHKEQVQNNAPPQGAAPCHPGIADYYAYHNDQGMMSDMSIADLHFLPHSSELSGTGVARLQRYAELLATSGGTLWYDTNISDKDLVDARLATARSYLAECSAGKNGIQVVLGVPGGPGMGFREAVAGAAVAQQPEKRETAYDFRKLKTNIGGGQ